MITHNLQTVRMFIGFLSLTKSERKLKASALVRQDGAKQRPAVKG